MKSFLSEADSFAQPRPALSFGEWGGAAARSIHSWIRHCIIVVFLYDLQASPASAEHQVAVSDR